MSGDVRLAACGGTDVDRSVSFHSLLERIAGELGSLSMQLTQIDHALGETLSRNEIPDHATLQQIDRLRQELEGLQHFAETLGKTVDTSGRCDPVRAAAGLKIRAQSSRLLGLETEAPSSDLW